MRGFEEDMEAAFLKEAEQNRELLTKYHPGQRVTVEIDEGSVINATIVNIYEDFNMGSFRDVFVDIEDEQGAVIERILAESITNIMSEK